MCYLDKFPAIELNYVTRQYKQGILLKDLNEKNHE
ncbi:hypothetical protein JOC83_003616 [Bacillus iocasae]|uniref:Uncharacterized protein n=1 Tax=Priestia iocasae TaxID=2291674 RepID=A0ABS2R0L6_9BACI|nr:hypothetical protein [Metabacillus iocasae]